jgi:hypothetical protein
MILLGGLSITSWYHGINNRSVFVDKDYNYLKDDSGDGCGGKDTQAACRWISFLALSWKHRSIDLADKHYNELYILTPRSQTTFLHLTWLQAELRSSARDSIPCGFSARFCI